MAKSSPSGSRGPAKRAASPADKKAQRQAGAKQAQKGTKAQQQVDERLLDSRARRNIAGVACLVGAAVLFVIASYPMTGVASVWLSTTLHLCLGVGCYVLPLCLVVLAIILFVQPAQARITLRVSLGLLLLFVAILVMFAIYTPGLSALNLDVLFFPENLMSQGGYVGAGIAWLLLMLFGSTVSIIIDLGLIAIAIVIIGLTPRNVAEQLRKAQDEGRTPHLPSFARRDPYSGQLPYEQPPAQAQQHRRRDAGAALRAQAAQDMDAPTIALDYGAGQAPAGDAPITRKLSEVPSKKPTERPKTTQSQEKQAQEAPTRKLTKKEAAQVSGPKPSEGFVLPSMNMLKKSNRRAKGKNQTEVLRNTALLLQDTLIDFGVNAEVVDWVAGPTVTLFKISLAEGVRVNRVTNLQDDIALALAAPGVRIFSPIPGTNYVGIEVPNVQADTVLLGDILPAAGPGPLEVVIGEDVEGKQIVDDLAGMPHLLVAGTTGSGKSVAVNGMIMSILMRATPAEVRFILVDPKRVEFTPYDGIPHLYVPVVTECREAASALSWAVAEMESRLKIFSKVGARNIAQYNAKAAQGMMIGEEQAEQLPFIVIVIDELADLMMNVGKEVEFSISRLAQLSRAAGIHMIIATQRPSTNIVTGLIKANITHRIALTVATNIDSRVIIDSPGAEALIGKGDMLYSKPEYIKPIRLQGCYTSDTEIEAVVEHLKQQGEPEYHNEILQTNLITLGQSSPSGGSGSDDDPLVWEAADIVVSSGIGSTSTIQRRLKVGYSRAGRIMDMLEEKGVVGPPNGSKPREVLVDAMELESLKAFELNDAN